MITLLSPSKKLNFNEQNIVHSHTECDFIQSAEILANEAKNLTENDLKDLMSISDNLAKLNRERFDRWSLPFNTSNAKQAILAFDGGVYSGLKAEDFKEKDFNFAQNHLRILSGLYGILKPLDLIQPYRLEMGISFKNKRGKKITVEVDNLKQLKEIMGLKFNTVLFDNMNIKNLKIGVKLAKKYYETEASGNINLRTAKSFATTGVDRISVGSITHSAPAIDFKLEI